MNIYIPEVETLDFLSSESISEGWFFSYHTHSVKDINKTQFIAVLYIFIKSSSNFVKFAAHMNNRICKKEFKKFAPLICFLFDMRWSKQ